MDRGQDKDTQPDEVKQETPAPADPLDATPLDQKEKQDFRAVIERRKKQITQRDTKPQS